MVYPGERFLRTSDVAKMLHVSPKTVSRWAKEGRLPHLSTLGGHRRFPATEIERLMDELSGAKNGKSSQVG
jgi:excisionase family DNA binding protein